MYNCYSGIQTARECRQPVSQSGANNGDVIGYMYKDSRYTSLRHKAEFTYDSLNRLTNSIAALGRTHAKGRHICATREYGMQEYQQDLEQLFSHVFRYHGMSRRSD
jgi:hypothetical protein